MGNKLLSADCDVSFEHSCHSSIFHSYLASNDSWKILFQSECLSFAKVFIAHFG